MATRNSISDITKLAKEVAKRDLESDSGDNDPQILTLIGAVTEQLRQRSGDNSQLNELISMIDATIASKTRKDGR